MVLLKWPAISRKIMAYVTLSFTAHGQPPKHLVLDIPVMTCMVPEIALYLPAGCTLAEAKVLMQLSRLSIRKTSKFCRRRQEESPC